MLAYYRSIAQQTEFSTATYLPYKLYSLNRKQNNLWITLKPYFHAK